MKALYYLAFAQSVDNNNNPIPAKKMKWFTPDSKKIAYEDIEFCNRERIELQTELTRYVVGIRKAGWFKNLWIHLKALSYDWVIVKG